MIATFETVGKAKFVKILSTPWKFLVRYITQNLPALK